MAYEPAMEGHTSTESSVERGASRRSAVTTVWGLWLPGVFLLALLVGAGLAGLSLLVGVGEAATLVKRTDDVRLSLSGWTLALADAETAQRAYLLTGDPEHLDRSAEARQRSRAHLAEVRRLTESSPHQQARLTDLQDLSDARFTAMDATVAAYRAGARGRELVPEVERGEMRRDRFRERMDAIVAEEEALGRARLQEVERRGRWMLVAFGAAVSTFLALIVTLRTRARFERQVEAERAKLHALIMQTPVAVALFEGPDHRCALCNAAYRRLVGSRPCEGLPLLEAIPELRGQPLAELLAATHRTGEPASLEEHLTPIAAGDGEPEERYITTTLRAVTDRHGRVTGVIVVGVDVTEQVLARRGLEADVRFAEQLVGILAHDLRTPLQAVTMASHLLKRALPEGSRSKPVERIASSTSRMGRMIEQILDLARCRLAGGIPIARAPADLGDVIRGVVDELATAHPDRAIRCSVEPGLTGDWDADRLAQALTNLAGNALAHGSPTSPVQITARADGDRVVLEVHNDGNPIPADLLPVLFEPYRRGRGTASSRGLGLGLFISDQIVRAHGGTLTVTSTAEDGTTFTVALPRGPATSDDRASSPAA